MKTNLKYREEQKLTFKDADDNFRALMYWSGVWQPGEYEANEVVRDGSWTMIANKTTTDRAAPTAIGQPFNLYDGTLTPTDVLTSQVRFGARFTTLENGVFVDAWRAFFNAGLSYQVFLTINPLDEFPQVEQILDFTAESTGWQSFPIGQKLVPPNTTIDIVAITKRQSDTPVTWVGNWNYQTPNNDDVPGSGVINHSHKALNTIRINAVDHDGGNRLTELQALVPGDIIRGGGLSWSINSSSTLAGVVSFVVIPATQSGVDGVQQFSFETVTPTLIHYDVEDDYYIGNAQISGLFSTNGSDVVVDDNAYGIDLTVQQANVSPDWDTVSISGGDAGSAGDEITLRYKKLGSPFTVIEPVLTDVMTFTVDDLPAGVYVGTVSFVSQYSTANDQLTWQMTDDLASPMFLKEAKDDSESIPMSYTFPIVWNGGPFTTTLQAMITGAGAADVVIAAANIFLNKVVGIEVA